MIGVVISMTPPIHKLVKRKWGVFIGQENDGVLIDTREILPNRINSRKFTYPSSIYGQRHGSNQSVSWNVRKHVPDDNYITDSQGILKNNHTYIM